MPINRQSLYAEVWAEPMTTVANRLGLQHWKLREVCTRHNIPTPPSGWWTKKRLGRRVEQTPLPRGENISIELPASEPLPDEPAIVVPEHITRYHPLVEQTRQVLKTLKPGQFLDRPLLIPREKSLHIAVTKAQVTRALRITDTLVRALDQRGYQPKLASKDTGLELTIFGQHLVVGLEEKCKQVTPPKDKLEWRKYVLEPTGVLALQVRSGKWVQYELVERPTKPLEERLLDFIGKLQDRARQEKAQDEQRERLKREWEEQQRLSRCCWCSTPGFAFPRRWVCARATSTWTTSF